jgi:UDP-2,3-diacylglucosamine pyrophosphatase LpxH
VSKPAITLTGRRDVRHHRTLFLSDTHLATRGCRADLLAEFLRCNDAETIYLVGDIIDFWSVRRGGVWPPSHTEVMRLLLAKMNAGSRLVLIPGNHDDPLRDYCGSRFGGIEVLRDDVHVTADGRRLLVMHGDELEILARFSRSLRFLNDRGRGLVRLVNMPLRLVRRFGVGLWSFSAHLRLRMKAAVNLIGAFERALVDEARRRGVDGVVCGHIHHPAHRRIGGIDYLNCGDWVHNCTAIVEDSTGHLHIIDWLAIERDVQFASSIDEGIRAAA